MKGTAWGARNRVDQPGGHRELAPGAAMDTGLADLARNLHQLSRGSVRRTRCKEGNLAYFYDHWGYRHYDVVVQFDCDHRPSPTYLAEMVRPFTDPAVGYVAAPSVCDANAATSWAARGRLYREATFHGAFQLGHSDGWAPACIGSHYAVRTTALQDIGGLRAPPPPGVSTPLPLHPGGWRRAVSVPPPGR